MKLTLLCMLCFLSEFISSKQQFHLFVYACIYYCLSPVMHFLPLSSILNLCTALYNIAKKNVIHIKCIIIQNYSPAVGRLQWWCHWLNWISQNLIMYLGMMFFLTKEAEVRKYDTNMSKFCLDSLWQWVMVSKLLLSHPGLFLLLLGKSVD